MHRFLTKLTAEQAEQQQQRIAAEVNAAARAAAAVRAATAATAAAMAASRLAARGPARPPRSAASATVANSTCSASSSADSKCSASSSADSMCSASSSADSKCSASSSADSICSAFGSAGSMFSAFSGADSTRSTSSSADSMCSASSSDEDEPEEVAASRKRSYTSWLASDDFHFIHDAVNRRQSFRRAVRELQERFPKLKTQERGKFDKLRASTLRHWYARDATGTIKLKDDYERFLGPRHGLLTISRGSGAESWWSTNSAATLEIVQALQHLRSEDHAGIAVGLRLLRWTVAAIAEKHGLANPPLSNGSLCTFAHEVMMWRWRRCTTTANKLPTDWQRQGEHMAMRIAVHIEFSKVEPCLIVNWDQTGIILVPAASRTYEKRGEDRVVVLGAEEKRQITAVLASSMDGDMLPLQLIFKGKTHRSRPAHTAASVAAGFHLTSTENHWSTQYTMQEYITRIIEPYRQRKIKERALPHDSRMILVLDAWSVHRSEEFRKWIATTHPLMHLVYVPANCTSHLQVADVVLQKPFKSKIRERFGDWAAEIIKQQATAGKITGLRSHFGIKELRSLVLAWTLDAWNYLASPAGKEMILKGWFKCVHAHFSVLDAEHRKKAVMAAVKGDLKAYDVVPVEEEPEKHGQDVWHSDCR